MGDAVEMAEQYDTGHHLEEKEDEESEISTGDLLDPEETLTGELVRMDRQGMGSYEPEVPGDRALMPYDADALQPTIVDTPQHAGLAMAESELEWMMTLAEMAFNSGMYPGATPAELMMKAMLGLTVGMVPAQAFTCIDVIRNKPSLGAETQRSLLPAWGLKLVQIRPEGWTPKDDADYCWLQLVREETGEVLGDACFTFQEAQRADLLRSDAWKKWTSDMLFARATTRVIARYAPWVLYMKPQDLKR